MLPVRIATCLVLAASALGAQTRFAGVQVNRAFREFHGTKAAMEKFDQERAAIEQDPRREQVAKVAAEAKQAEQAITEAPGDDPATRLQAQRQAELKADELRALTNALREARNNRTTDLNQRLVATTRQLLDTVRQTAAEVGKERGFDAVVDISGHSNTGVPVILYARNLPDLTNEVIARLNREAAPAAEPPPATPGGPAGATRQPPAQAGQQAPGGRAVTPPPAGARNE